MWVRTAVAAVAGVALMTATPAGRQTAPPFALPLPTGSHAIGTTAWTVVDDSRPEPFLTGTRRQIRVEAWYPATRVAGAASSPYLLEGPADAATLSALIRAPGAYDRLADVVTHSQVEAPLVARPSRFPVLVTSQGYTGNPSAGTALLEELASQGYVVLNIVHPYEMTAATLSDGSVVTMVDGAGRPRPELLAVLGEWQKEDETMAQVTRTNDAGEQLRLLRGYLSALPNTNIVVRRWVDDIKSVLNGWTSIPASAFARRLAARLDMNRLGAFGHSMGGVTAAQFCTEDRRCRATLNLDGIPQYGGMIDMPLRRPLLMVYSARPGRAGASDALYRRAASPYYRVDVRDTLHTDFTDMPFWGGPLRQRGAFGAIAPERAAAITRTIVREFFDQELRGMRSPLLSGRTQMPEVTVRR